MWNLATMEALLLTLVVLGDFPGAFAHAETAGDLPLKSWWMSDGALTPMPKTSEEAIRLRQRLPKEGNSPCLSSTEPAGFHRGYVQRLLWFDASGLKIGWDSEMAFTPSCTHQKTTVKYNHKRRRLECPAHGSRFDLQGFVLKEPATRPLPTHEAVLSEGHIILSLEEE